MLEQFHKACDALNKERNTHTFPSNSPANLNPQGTHEQPSKLWHCHAKLPTYLWYSCSNAPRITLNVIEIYIPWEDDYVGILKDKIILCQNPLIKIQKFNLWLENRPSTQKLALASKILLCHKNLLLTQGITSPPKGELSSNLYMYKFPKGWTIQ